MVIFTYSRGYLRTLFQLADILIIFGPFEGLYWPYFESVNGYDYNENGFGTP